MTRTILYDATQAIEAPARAEPADRDLARRLAAEASARVCMTRVGRNAIVAISPAQARARLAATPDSDRRMTEAFAAARARILGAGPSTAAPPPKERAPRRGRVPWRRAAAQAPRGAIFLKVGWRGWENPFLEAWLESRPDVLAVAVLREPWELSFPEYASAEEAAAAARAWAAIGRRAAAVIALNETARARSPGAQVLPTPSEVAGSLPADLDPALAAAPFLLQVGPIEARANSLLLLQIWRELAHGGAPVPKLVLVGERGAQTNEIAPMLDWADVIRPHVCEAGCPDREGLRRLLVHARALLAPDFAAPDNALLRDASALGAKVLASDIPTFREIRAPGVERLDPLSGPAWRSAILSAAQAAPRQAPDTAVLPDWEEWSRELFAVLDGL